MSNCSKNNSLKGSSSNTRWLVNNGKKSDIWTSTNYTEERQRIREFWLQLSELERRSLVKVEKEAVLRKMKEQQRHPCNCSVCGKDRSAVEEELEVIYDAYYEELEQYAYRQQHKYTTVIRCKKDFNHRSTDHDDDDSKPAAAEITNTLTVKGSIITVADDLLENDGRKFLDMMEKLAERKMQKERQVASMSEDDHNDDDDDEEEEDHDTDEIDEGDDDDEDEDNEENEEGDSRTEEQRMEEGRKVFQVFAARLFEQRVLAAYREKVAQDRQKRLIEELEEEDRQRQERELRKQQEKEKKKDRKRQLKLQQEQERLELENKKKQEELAAKADRERKLKMERQIKEQERLKREEERLQKERDRLRKEDEKKKRKLKEEADKERKRKEEERQKKIKEEEEKRKKEAVEAIAVATSTATAAASAIQEDHTNNHHNIPSSSTTTNQPQHHHILTDSMTTMTPIGQRRTSLAGPIGSPVRSRSVNQSTNQYVTSDSEAQHSFFSNFLFGQSSNTSREHQESFNTNSRRVSSDGSNLKWSNGWTPLTALSDNVHGKLFGDVLATGDRSTIILERARFAYMKLDELANAKFFMIPNFHTLDQVHHMMCDLFYDIAIDARELYSLMNHHPSSEFKCYYNQPQQCYIVQYGIMPLRSTSSSLLPPASVISPPLQPHPSQLPTFQHS